MMEKQQSKEQQEIVLASAPDRHYDKYKKQQIFSFITNKNLSNLVMLPGAGIFWVGGFIYCNENKISPLEVNYTRYFMQIASIFTILKMTGEKVDFRNGKEFKMLLVRSVISAVNGLVSAFFQMYLPLPIYYTISASTTIFAFILNYFLFGIHITIHQVKAVILAFVGIVLVINGRALYQFFDSSYQFTSTFDYSSTTLGVQMLMGVLVTVWSCIWAYAIVITGKHHASFHEFILINSVLGHLLSSALEITIPLATEVSVSDLFVRKPQKLLATLIYCGLPLAIANYMFILGMFISENTGVSTMISQVNIIYGYFIGKIRYDEEVNYICLIGAVLLIGSIYTTIFKK